MSAHRRPQRGFTIVELMVALTLGILLIGAVISVYLAQSQVYKGSNSQAAIQNAENAIAALVTPTIRATGFSGCSTMASALSNLVAGGPPPLGTLGSTPSMIAGYGYINPAGANQPLLINPDNPANDTAVADWSPSLDATLAGAAIPGSDVVVLLGAAPGSQAVGATSVPSGSANLSVQDASPFSAGHWAAISDCLKSSVFQVDSATATTITRTAGSAAMTNATAALAVNFAPGAQVVPLSQVAFYVASGTAGQSVLTRATLADAATWTIEPLVPGVELMVARYGIGSNGVVTQYVPASAVTNWASVYSLRLAMLIEGQPGSAQTGAATTFSLLGQAVTAPNDTRLRHVYEMTIDLRNAAP